MARVFPSIHKARERKTTLFLYDRPQFMALLVLDVIKFIGYCTRKGKKPAIRLNGTSDIQWETIEVECGQNIFQMFPEVQFYDYTKIPNRKVSHIPNYHLTWSYSEANKKYADYFNRQGFIDTFDKLAKRNIASDAVDKVSNERIDYTTKTIQSLVKAGGVTYDPKTDKTNNPTVNSLISNLNTFGKYKEGYNIQGEKNDLFKGVTLAPASTSPNN